MSPRTHKERDLPVHFWHRINPADKILFYSHLANLVDGGVSIMQALHSFLDKTDNPKMYAEIRNLIFFIDSGNAFHVAMKKLPLVFDRREVAVVEAGEASGTIHKSFMNLAEEMRVQEDLKRKVTGSLTYPAIIIFFLVGAILVIMTFVIPKLKPLFADAGMDLPLITRTLIATSDFISGHFIALAVGIVALIALLRIYLQSESGRRVFDGWYLSIPVVGAVYKNYSIVRVASSLGLLLSAGIPIIRTITLTSEGVNNLLYQRALEDVSRRVSMGHKLTKSFEDSDPDYELFTRDFIQMMGAGEQTSTVHTVCMKVADQYKREVERSLDILIKFVEPLAILFAGLFVLWFAFGIFSAVIQLTQTVSG